LARLRPILEERPESAPGAESAGQLTGAISLQGVRFAYPGSSGELLRGVSLDAASGDFVAIVGTSGCGKSTLAQLILGLRRPTAGKVLFDGRDLASLDLVSVRRQIGVVGQHARVIPGSILENIVGATLLSQDDAWEAAEASGLADDIREMPMQMHTFISDQTLSGGQLQKLLIARALVTRPRILLFDEATSALDEVSQAHVSRSPSRSWLPRKARSASWCGASCSRIRQETEARNESPPARARARNAACLRSAGDRRMRVAVPRPRHPGQGRRGAPEPHRRRGPRGAWPVRPASALHGGAAHAGRARGPRAGPAQAGRRPCRGARLGAREQPRHQGGSHRPGNRQRARPEGAREVRVDVRHHRRRWARRELRAAAPAGALEREPAAEPEHPARQRRAAGCGLAPPLLQRPAEFPGEPGQRRVPERAARLAHAAAPARRRAARHRVEHPGRRVRPAARRGA
ncbi:MAG: ATP-binding cassette domain-containing protein, partial [Proteobacteria bacterium]|nr:ATP-binding cassette domain-containing protein [Pseudomonadota bacterium]